MNVPCTIRGEEKEKKLSMGVEKKRRGKEDRCRFIASQDKERKATSMQQRPSRRPLAGLDIARPSPYLSSAASSVG
jgi:hypothetical protein